ncbi:hypothetical protein ACIQXG_19340 [Lysinibacillus sphaericus]
MQIEKGGKVITVTEKAYEIVYKAHGFKPHTKPKTTRRKASDDHESE